jgi:hypothetical protein
MRLLLHGVNHGIFPTRYAVKRQLKESERLCAYAAILPRSCVSAASWESKNTAISPGSRSDRTALKNAKIASGVAGKSILHLQELAMPYPTKRIEALRAADNDFGSSV